MKFMRIFFVFQLALPILMLSAQEDCRDVVYPTGGKSLIFNCCIEEIRNGNIVYFTVNGEAGFVEAVAISKNGQYIDLTNNANLIQEEQVPTETSRQLYKGRDYNYYAGTFVKATRQRNTGIALTTLGVTSSVIGIVILSEQSNKLPFEQNDSAIYAGAWLYLGGAILFNVGAPVLISGAIRRGNNKKAMERTGSDLSLHVGYTVDGIGLRLSF